MHGKATAPSEPEQVSAGLTYNHLWQEVCVTVGESWAAVSKHVQQMAA